MKSWSFKLTSLAAVFLFVFSVNASAALVQSCEKAGVGLNSVIQPASGNILEYWNGQLTVYHVKTNENVASDGLAIVYPTQNGSKCSAVVQITDWIKFQEIEYSYNASKGARLVVPLYYKSNGRQGNAGSLHIRVDADNASVFLE